MLIVELFFIPIIKFALLFSEPQPALNLIQPIMPKYLATDYYIFVEQFDWKTGNDYQSNAIYVTPGQRVFGSITYDSTNDTYLMETGIVGMANNSIASYAPYYHKGQVFTDAYIVLEHQPTLCAQFPSSNQITFDNIKVVWENGVKTPSWKSFQYKPACNSTTTVVNSTKVKINWQS